MPGKSLSFASSFYCSGVDCIVMHPKKEIEIMAAIKSIKNFFINTLLLTLSINLHIITTEHLSVNFILLFFIARSGITIFSTHPGGYKTD